jgi:hypothetical protein
MMGWFAQGGPSMWVIALICPVAGAVAVSALVFAVVARWRGTATWSSRGVALMALVGACAVPCTGVLGWVDNHLAVEEAVAFADPSVQALIRTAGQREAVTPMIFGVLASLVTVVPALLAGVLAFAPRRSK